MAKPINETQRQFEQLCAHGGGFGGGPVKLKVLEVLRASGQALNEHAYGITKEQFTENPGANPWYVCFAIGLAWGHLAKLEPGFTAHVVNVLTDWNDYDLSGACEYYLERGPEPIENSLKGAYGLFSKVTLPVPLPSTLEKLYAAQEKWLTPIFHSQPPKYIGSWNATAMFMAALFAQPSLAKTQRKPKPLLPPSGPVLEGLRMLYSTHILSKAPEPSESGDWASALAVNNELLTDLLAAPTDCLLDIHSGVYMLGTRDPRSDGWI